MSISHLHLGKSVMQHDDIRRSPPALSALTTAQSPLVCLGCHLLVVCLLVSLGLHGLSGLIHNVTSGT